MVFDVFDNYMSSAKYDEAQKKLDTIEEMIMNLYGHIETIATYCNIVNEIIPGLLDDLAIKNQELERKGYVVKHAKVPQFIENTKIVLEDLKDDFKHLSFAQFDDVYSEIQEKLTEVHARLDQEVSAKNTLDQRYAVVSKKISEAEASFIETKRHFATMKEYYQLPDAISVRFSNFEKNSTRLADLKREYEGYIFADVHNPASYMLEKVSAMDNLCDTVIDDIKYFINYFDNSKLYVEETYQEVNKLLKSLVILLGKVRYNKCHVIYNKYESSVQNLISRLKDTNNLLLEKPINLGLLQNTFPDIVSECNDITININNELDNFKTVEKTIVFANPLRYQFVSADSALKEAEQYFVNGEYRLAQEKLNYVLSNYHPAAYDAFKENE